MKSTLLSFSAIETKQFQIFSLSQFQVERVSVCENKEQVTVHILLVCVGCINKCIQLNNDASNFQNFQGASEQAQNNEQDRKDLQVNSSIGSICDVPRIKEYLASIIFVTNTTIEPSLRNL